MHRDIGLLFLIKMFCQRSEAVFGRNDHKRRTVEIRCQKLNVPFFSLIPSAALLAFLCFVLIFIAIYSSLKFHTKFHII